MFNLSPILVIVACSFALGKNLPPGLKLCSKSAPDFNECLTEAIAAGVVKFAQGNKDLGVPNLEPFLIDTLDLGTSDTGSVALHQVYNNMQLYGMTQRNKLRNLEANFTGESCHWKFDAESPVLRMEADYKISGKILLFPINGFGKCNNSLFDVDVNHEMFCEKYKKKNKVHIRVVDYKMVTKPKSVTFDLENLVEGNEQLSKEVLKTINENWESVYGDIGEGFSKAFSLIYKNLGNSVFSKIPEDEIFLP